MLGFTVNFVGMADVMDPSTKYPCPELGRKPEKTGEEPEDGADEHDHLL